MDGAAGETMVIREQPVLWKVCHFTQQDNQQSAKMDNE